MIEKLEDNKLFTLVIGCVYSDVHMCFNVIEKLGSNFNYIKEIICIVSNVESEDQILLKQNFEAFSELIKIFFYDKIIFPGHARNIGVKNARSNYIAFLDARTIPEDNWLEIAYKLLILSKQEVFLGATRYFGTSTFEKCFIASTYGDKPLTTVPGTVISKKLFYNVGSFIPSLRSGEDGEWMERASYFQPNLKDKRMIPLKYENIKGKTFIYLCKKWYKNYSKCSEKLLIYQRQRYMYIIFFTSIIFFSALSWNENIALNETSYLYLPHVSKISVALLFITYTVIRAIILPIKKGFKIFRSSILEIIMIYAISFILDIVKTIAFIKASFYQGDKS